MELTTEKKPRTINKESWPHGPWMGEPDFLQFKTAEGFDGVIIRTIHSGALCGYVGIPASHPWHGKEYGAEISPSKEQLGQTVDMDKISIISLFAAAANAESIEDFARIDCIISVHGGLTYSSKGRSDFNEDPALWYFGFDCNHYGDFAPGMGDFMDGSYRDIEYVQGEVARLSQQLSKAGAA